ncbi:diguanylate cyclase [Lujinxingia vulgaris]|nr:diguanylate cyclase [Lujinxingia vulgaris]
MKAEMRHVVMVSQKGDPRLAELREALAREAIALTHLAASELTEGLPEDASVVIIEAALLTPAILEALAHIKAHHLPFTILTLGESEHADAWVPADASIDVIVDALKHRRVQLQALPEPGGSLHEDSVAMLEESSKRHEFIERLDEEIAHLSQLAEDVARGALSARTLAQATGPVRAAARHHQLNDVARPLEELESLAEATASASPDAHFQQAAAALFETLRARVRAAQLDDPETMLTTESLGRALTVVVIDDDPNYLRQIERFAEQFMIRVRTATSVDEAINKVQTPLLAGVVLTIQEGISRKELTESMTALQRASHLAHLPLALVSDVPDTLDRVQGLWAGASHIATRPVSAVSFSQIARRLATSRRALLASVMVVDPQGVFATRVAQQLGERDMAIHYLPDARTIFEALEHHRPDLVLLSTELAEVATTDLCRSLRAVASWREVPIVIFAAESTPEARIAAYQAGADDFIDVAISPHELVVRLSVRLERARQAQERSDRDLLTGLLTRRPFLEQLAARMSEVTRRRRRLVFAILDVDHFKEVNDRHGHLVGDRVLATLGRLLQDRFRIEDLRARWGGEEFVIVLVDEGLETSTLALRRVLDEFYAMRFEGGDGERFSVSFSAGLACFPQDGQDTEALLSVADARLLRAKREGRCRIEPGRNYRSV